jgi:DNA-damage-inducible protein J
MTENAVIRARIDVNIKDEASLILKSMGITMSDAFRMLMMRIVADKALPFNPLIPNAETIKAIKAARKGNLTVVKNPDDLISSLNLDD